MKNVYFPSWWNIHNGRLSRNSSDYYLKQTMFYANGRALYGDWGRFGNVALDDKLNAFSEFNLENPLSYKLDAFYYKKEDEILFNEDNPHFIVNRKELISTFIYFRNNVERMAPKLKRKYRKDMGDFINAVDGQKSMKVLRRKSSFVPASFQYLVDKKSNFLLDETAADLTMLSSPIYTGGCLKVVTFKTIIYVIFCDGVNMSKITVSKLNLITNNLEKTEIYQYEIDGKNESIFQLEAVIYGECINVLIRFMDSIYLLKISQSHEKLSISKSGLVNSMDQFICCKIGNKWAREFMGTFSDKIELYDANTNRNIWSKDTILYTSVIDKWNEVQLASVPKVWLHTNRSNSHVYDTRINPFSSGLELFNTQLNLFSKNESLYHATNIFKDHYFYLFSTFNGILVDIRSPLIAVNQWTVPSMSPISYSSIDMLSHISKINVTLGSQLDAKHLTFQQHFDNNSKSTALTSKSNLEASPVMSLGISSYFNTQTDELSVLTLDNLGNIIGSQYKLNGDLYNYHTISSENGYCYRSTKRLKEFQNSELQSPIYNYRDILPRKTATIESIELLNRYFNLNNENE